jgi:hypothetical protein
MSDKILTDRAAELLREALADAEWCDKNIYPTDGEGFQNWLLKVYLPVPLSAKDKSPEAALRAALEQKEPLSQDDINWLKARPHIEQFIKEQDHDVTITDRSVTFKSREKVDVHQSKQEPVAWIPSQHLEEARRAPFVCRVSLARQRHRTDFVALYTHPPRREWQGLTNGQRMELEYTSSGVKRTAIEMAFAVEAKLKEKNA